MSRNRIRPGARERKARRLAEEKRLDACRAALADPAAALARHGARRQPDDPWLPPSAAAEYGRFLAIALPFLAADVKLVPTATANTKEPGVAGFGRTGRARRWNEYGGEPQTAADLLYFAKLFRDSSVLVFPGSGKKTVVDLDSADLFTWGLKTFGPSPLEVSTGREEGGLHRYFEGRVRKKNQIVKNVDIVSDGQGCIAPGSRHASGSEYAASVAWADLPDALRQLPEYPLDVHADLLASPRRPRKSSGGSKRSSATGDWHESTETIADSVLVTLDDGEVVALVDVPRGRKFHSPWRPDTHPSCDVYRGCVCDFSTGERRRIVEPPVEIPGVRRVSVPLDRVEQSIRDCPANTTMLVRAPVGARKTQGTVELAKRLELTSARRCNAMGERALIVAPSKMLRNANAARFTYDIQPRVEKDSFAVSTTYKSMPNYLGERYAFAFVDELASCLAQCDSIAEWSSWDRMCELLAFSGRGVGVDADVTDQTVALAAERIQQLNPGRHIIFLEATGTALARHIQQAHVDEVWQAAMADAKSLQQGERKIVIMHDEKHAMHEMAEEIRRCRPELRVLVIDGDFVHSDTTPDEILQATDILFCNSAINDGISFSVPVHAQYYIHTQAFRTGESVCQQIARVRELLPEPTDEENRPCVLMGMSAFDDDGTRPTETEAIIQAIHTRVEYAGQHTHPLDDDKYLVRVAAHFRSEQNKALNKPWQSFFENVERYGWTHERLTWFAADSRRARTKLKNGEEPTEEETAGLAQHQAVKLARKAVRKAHKALEGARTIHAPVADADRVAELRQQRSRLRPGDRYELERHSYIEIFGYIDQKLVDQDLRHGLRRRVRGAVHTMMLDDHPEVLTWLDRRGATHIADVGATKLQARLSKILGQRLGVRYGEAWCMSQSDIESVVKKFCDEHLDDIHAAGWGIPTMHFTRWAIRHGVSPCGADRVKSHKRNGEREYFVESWLDPEILETCRTSLLIDYSNAKLKQGVRPKPKPKRKHKQKPKWRQLRRTLSQRANSPP